MHMDFFIFSDIFLEVINYLYLSIYNEALWDFPFQADISTLDNA